ncbi:hypothetical protein [Streptomyces sp. NPDC046942]|uniref:hypothetical protein n=1 Tax=Streptomyces sp. NPDC046942 TaxID=3155137 RepID=UPI0033EBFF29
MVHWVYAFTGCPGTGDYQLITNQEEPGDVVFRDRPGGLGIVDAFVREHVDHIMMVVRYRWVADEAPSTVTPAVQEALG